VKLAGGFFRRNSPERIVIEYRRVLPRQRILNGISGYDEPDSVPVESNRLRMTYTIQNNWRKEIRHFELALTDYPSEDFKIENFRVRSDHQAIDTDLRDVVRVHEIPFDVYAEQRDAPGRVRYEWRFSLPEGVTTVEFDYRWEEEGQ
jgi:hypothetical protein